jgi:hypothetical protein
VIDMGDDAEIAYVDHIILKIKIQVLNLVTKQTRTTKKIFDIIRF